jgi:hypothetical protein
MEATSGSNIDAYDLVIVDPLRGALRQGGGTDLGRGGLRARTKSERIYRETAAARRA